MSDRGADSGTGRSAPARLAHLTAVLAAVAWTISEVIVAITRPLWLDEIITYEVSSAPSLGEVFRAIYRGADLSPFLFHAIEHGALSLNDSALLLRLPSLAGFLLFLLALYVIVARTAGQWTALAAALIAALTAALPYASEARPYALLLGFASLSLATWQRLDSKKPDRLQLALLTLSLWLMVSLHLYGALLMLPLAAGQAVREGLRGRRQWLVWGAFASIALPLAAHVPWILEIQSRYPVAVATEVGARLEKALLCVSFLIAPALAAISLAFALLAGRRIVAKLSGRKIPASSSSAFSPAELAAAAGFFLFPIVVAFAPSGPGLMVPRYFLAFIIGFTLLFAHIERRLCACERTWMMLSLMLAIFLAHTQYQRIHAAGSLRHATDETISRLETLAASEPIAGGTTALHLLRRAAFYAPPLTRRRLTLLLGSNLNWAIHVTNAELARCCDAPFAALAPYVEENPSFLFLGHPDDPILADLRRERVVITPLAPPRLPLENRPDLLEGIVLPLHLYRVHSVLQADPED